MYCFNAIIVLSLSLILFCDPTSSECTQLAPCVCSLPDGVYYNLTGLADAEPFVDTKFQWTAYFHPCTNVKMKTPNNTCDSRTGVSLCIYKENDTKNITGSIEEMQMKLSSEGKFPIFEIHHSNDTKSVINIMCITGKKTFFTFDSPPTSDSKTYYFMLVSPYGCKIQPEKGLSMGSVLVILFFVCAGIYFIGGIIVLKALRGATGWEMVPNHDFWRKLPSLVRDGVIFTFNCCRGDSYERI